MTNSPYRKFNGNGVPTPQLTLLSLLLQRLYYIFGSSGDDLQAFIDEFDLMISNQDVIQF